MKGPRIVEAAFVLPWLGVALLTPPVTFIVNAAAREAGVPLFVPYLFVVWALLILAAWALSRRLREIDRNAAENSSAPMDQARLDERS